MKRPSIRHLSILAILLIAFVLRYHRLDHGESYPERLAHRSYDLMLSLPGQSDLLFAHGLYPAAASALFDRFDIIAVRFLSLGFGLGSVLAAFSIGRDLFGPRAAWLSALLVAISPHMVFQSQQATSLAVATSLALCVVACHFRAIGGGGRGWRVAYLTGFAGLACLDFSSLTHPESQAAGLTLGWGPAALVLIAIACVDLLRKRESPINRARVALTYLLPLICFSPALSKNLTSELQAAPDPYTMNESLFTKWQLSESARATSQQALIEHDLTYNFSSYKIPHRQMVYTFAHHLIGHGKLQFNALGRAIKGRPINLRKWMVAAAGGLSAVCMAATLLAFQLRRPKELALAVRVRLTESFWTGARVIVAFFVVAPIFAYALAWFIHPRSTDLPLLLGASGGMFLIVVAAGIDKLLSRRWAVAIFVLPLIGVLLLGLRESYQLFDG